MRRIAVFFVALLLAFNADAINYQSLIGVGGASTTAACTATVATSVLLHMDGTNASTTFTDSSANAFTVTASGNAQLATAQEKFGTASGVFDGTGDFLSLGGQTAFNFGSGDYTVDFWLRLNATGSEQIVYDSRPASSSGLYPFIDVSSGNVVRFNLNGVRITGTTTMTTATWYDVALTRSGTSTKLFLNGTQEGSTFTDANTYLIGTTRPMIGASGFDSGTAFGLNGWIDELRVVKGTAVWTSNFTPPTLAYCNA